MKKKTLIIFCLLVLQIPQIGLGSDREVALLNQVESMLKQPESEVDVVIAMLTIDKIIDPSVEVGKYLRKIDALLAEVVKQSKDPLGDIQGLNKAAIYAILFENKIYLSGILGPQIKTEEEYYKELDSRYTELHHTADNLGDEKPSEKDNAEILERIRKIKNKEENV